MVATGRSVHDTGLVLVVFVGVSALKPQYTRITLRTPTLTSDTQYLTQGLLGGRSYLGDSVASCSFGGTWGILLPLIHLEASFGS
jgi:hypothetical protein